ncbi:cbb3-type cytochrome c oxidase subunit I [Azohydromonas caseinilytica]|uniref:Cytochrome ubiquinol oxidase subunit I n=1 Tax=Azohydromonas caseinilytica TaxID=2728836 RepID=A0A848FDX7_9BURK|nr:cbb3-type cytochrome c oxidase subunit I [Azohydromonas caseinilytica]NML16579.1 cytochrome ubiquinol oxidase subunit I [Azohydromonas caseinilytica]
MDTAPLPNTLPRPEGELPALERAWASPRGWRRLTDVNNTFIGQLYIATALLFLLLAGVLGLLMRAQLAVPGNTLLDAGTYNQVFTMHGTVMMFLFAVPIVEAIAVYLLPNMLGARDLPFPRLSAYAYWAYAFGGLAFFCTLFVGLAPDGGWFMYPPLTSRVESPGLNADFWLLGIGFIEISAIAGAVELIIGILMTRAPGLSLARMPVYAWAMLVVGVMIVFAFPAVIAGTALLELERAFDWPYFDAARGGDPLLWQHLFWFFGHPEVYIIFLPAAGMVSTFLPALVQAPLAGRRAIVAALLAVGVFSFALWAHHMFSAGLGTLSLTLVSAASMAVAVPAGLQVFGWLATLARGRVRADTPTLFVIGFLLTFTLGGLTGVMVAVLPFDWQAHDSYFIVAHLHYVLIGGVLFPVFAALYYWLPLLNGHTLSERCGRWVFGLVFGGFHLAFFPLHIAGLRGMPRRVYTYDAGLGWELPNLLSSLGAALLGLGVGLLSVDLVRTLRRPAREHGNPWRAPTLEWLPSANYGTRSIPQVDGRDPLWRRPALAEEVQAGRHWLPGTATGARETIVTSARGAQPRHLILLPGPSWLPFIAALGTAGFFLLLTVKWVLTAWACGLLAVACVWAWLWRTDRLPATTDALVAEGVRLPVGAALTASHSWWATVILQVVDATVLASIAFAHLHLAMRLEVCPPPGAALPPLSTVAGAAGAFAASALLWAAAGRGLSAGRLKRWRLLPLGGALALALGGFALLLRGHADAGLAPTASGWGASVAGLLGYQGFHMALMALCAAYLAARLWRRLVTPRQRATWDNVALLWWGGCAQGVVVALLPHAAAAWLP